MDFFSTFGFNSRKYWKVVIKYYTVLACILKIE